MEQRIVFASPLVTAMRLTCDIRRSGPAASYPVPRTWVGFALSGVFSLHARGDEHVVHAGIGAVFPRGIEYRMSHPTDHGDTAFALGFASGVSEEAFRGIGEQLRVSALDVRMRYAVGLLMAAIDRGDEALAIDEMSLAIARELGSLTTATPDGASVSARRRVRRVRELLAEAPDQAWTLAELATAVGWSPFHLAHQFRAQIGTSVHRYLADIRVAAALRRIESGEASLAAIAVDLGFAHHSHLTATLRRRLGVTPRLIRQRLRATS